MSEDMFKAGRPHWEEFQGLRKKYEAGKLYHYFNLAE